MNDKAREFAFALLVVLIVVGLIAVLVLLSKMWGIA